MHAKGASAPSVQVRAYTMPIWLQICVARLSASLIFILVHFQSSGKQSECIVNYIELSYKLLKLRNAITSMLSYIDNLIP